MRVQCASVVWWVLVLLTEGMGVVVVLGGGGGRNCVLCAEVLGTCCLVGDVQNWIRACLG